MVDPKRVATDPAGYRAKKDTIKMRLTFALLTLFALSACGGIPLVPII